MKSQEVKNLMEAYASIYMEQKQLEEGEQLDEMDIVGKLRRGLNKIGVKGTSPALERESGADRESRRLGTNRMRQTEGDNTRPTPMKDDVDLFDIVKGYLVSEGATEEEVYDMMAHLTAEQVEAIVESGYFPTKESQREDEKKYNLSRGELPGRHKPQKPQKPQKPGM